MTRYLVVAVALLVAKPAHAEPNPDIDAYCRQRTESYDSMRRCIEAEEESRAAIAARQKAAPVDPVLSCVNLLAEWDKANPCPPERLAEIIEKLRLHKPCN